MHFILSSIICIIVLIISIYIIGKKKKVANNLLLLLVVTSSIGVVNTNVLVYGTYAIVVTFILVQSKKRYYSLSPLREYVLFIVWAFFSILIPSDPSYYYGVLMVVKYFVPVLFFIAAYKTFISKNDIIEFYSKTVSYWPFFLVVGVVGALMNTIDIIYPYFGASLLYMPFFLSQIKKNRKKRYILISILLLIPALLFSKRTPIIGCLFGFTFVLCVKYKLKAIIPITLLAVFAVLLVFYIPNIKEKFFFDSSITLSDLLNAGMEFENINSNGRTYFWGVVYDKFYIGHELIGSGTGYLKTFLHSAQNPNIQSFEMLHNDWLHILCENGTIGFSLIFLGMTLCIVRCKRLINKKSEGDKKAIFYALCFSYGEIIIHMFFENCINSFSYSFFFMNYAIVLRYLKCSKSSALIRKELLLK